MTTRTDSISQRTNLVGRNRLELLLFVLGSEQRFGINVFKVREVIRCPRLTRIPQCHALVRGMVNIRGKTITVIDLGLAIQEVSVADPEQGHIIITEFNRCVQGFLVRRVDRIVNMNWAAILPPPKGTGVNTYMTAVTQVEGEIVEIMDVEKVLAEVTGLGGDLADPSLGGQFRTQRGATAPRVLVVDDSSVARKQIVRVLDQIGVRSALANDGEEAFETLKALGAARPVGGPAVFDMVISDIEMPRMDGYTLTKLIKENPQLRDLHVLLHTSLSGVFNRKMVEYVGADEFIPKFDGEDLARAVLNHVSESTSSRQ